MRTTIQQCEPCSPPDDVLPGVTFGAAHRLTCEAVESIADACCSVSFGPEAIEAIAASHATLAAAHAGGSDIYGLTTGYGPHVRYGASADGYDQGADLIAHLGAGCGPRASRRVVRATLAARCQALALGYSGIAPSAADALLSLLHADICPMIPTIGSVGASGDLIPLAHVASVLAGVGHVMDATGAPVEAAGALQRAGLAPQALSGRDALALVNGTSFMTAHAALAVARADRLIRIAESLTAWSFRTLGGRHEAMDPRIHEARGHSGQIASAARIASELGGHTADVSRPLQEVYSLRCAPQVLGACRDQLVYARGIIECELNGVNDNPVICGTPDTPAVLHGGNFQGQQIAFAADAANAAVVQASLMIERQLDVLANPELNGGAPLLLAWDPGATSGIAGAQITATAVAAEMRRNATPSAVATIPTNGRNQDVVSMGTMAARVCYEQTERAAVIMAILAIGLGQYAFLRTQGRCRGPSTQPPQWMPAFNGFDRDRALHSDIQRISLALLRADVFEPTHAATAQAPPY